MENENTKQTEQDNSLMYVVGAVVVIAIVIAAILMWPKQKKQTTVAPAVSEQQVETKPMYTKLTCDKEWYNPVVGLPKFYLSAEGGDVAPTSKITCAFTVMNGTDILATEKVDATITSAPERGGMTFSCTTKAVEKLPQNVPLKMNTVVTNDQNTSASCSGAVTFRQ